MLLFHVCVRVCVHAHCVWAHLYVCVHVHAYVLWRTCKVRGQLCGVDSLLSPLSEFWGWYSGLLVCNQMLLPAEPHMSASAVFSFRDCIILPSTMSSNLSILLHVSELLPY